jgi:hypothetical protein
MPTTRQAITCFTLSVNLNSIGSREDLACRIWEQLKNAHAGNSQVQARLFVTYKREYKNFTHLPGESIDTMF